MRGLRALAIIGLAVSVLVLAGTGIAVAWSLQGTTQGADAVVVLSGDRGARLDEGLDIVRSGAVRVLVLAGQRDSLDAMRQCRGMANYEVVCLTPRPDNTRNEARAAAALARQRSWDKVAVVTAAHHVARSRLLFSRCLPGTVVMVGVPPQYSVGELLRELGREWLAYGHAVLVDRRC